MVTADILGDANEMSEATVVLSPNVTIRKAVPNEWKSIVEFFDLHLHNLYHDPGFLPSGMVRDHIGRGNVIVAVSDAGILGVALTNGRTLWNLVVNKNYRRKGVGSKLLNSIGPKYVRIKRHGGFPDPTSFYEKNGYRPLAFVPSAATKKKTILLAERIKTRSARKLQE